MNFFGRLNAFAQNAVGGLVSKVERLDDWRPDVSPERVDYAALWRAAIAPVHPIVDARVRLRVVERNIQDRYACRQPPVTTEIDALDASVKGALAVAALRRFVFLDYCVYWNFNNGNDPVRRLDWFGVTKEALLALESDFEQLTHYLFGRAKPPLDGDQTAQVARIVGFMAAGAPTDSTIKDLLVAVEPVLCQETNADRDKKRAAWRRLFERLGEGKQLTVHPDFRVIQLVERLAALAGVSAEMHPIVVAKRAAENLVTEAKQAIVDLGGPQLRGFFQEVAAQNAFAGFARNYVKDKADTSALDALTPAERGEALFGCLRVFNFTSHCGRMPGKKPWPDCKLSSFDKAAYPRMADYTEGGYSGMALADLFQHLARRKVELNEAMQWELSRVLRSNAAEHLVRSLQVVKIVEDFARGNTSPRVRAELEAVIGWLKTTDDHQTKKFREGALHRLQKALDSMAQGDPTAPASTQTAGASGAGPREGVVGVPGGFGRRAEPSPPAAGAATVAARPAPSASQATPLSPPRKPDANGRPVSLVDFYGDLADLRKCTAEHVAFLDEQLGGEFDIEAETRRRVAVRPMLRGLTQEQQANMHAYIRADVVRERDQRRAVAEMLKARVLVVGSVGGEAPAVWAEFHDHARALYGKSKPAAAWLKRACEILHAVPVDSQAAMVKAAAGGYPCFGAHSPTDDVVRGLIYVAVRLPAEKAGSAIAEFARRECFQTVPGSGIRDKRMGNACLWTLINMPEGAGVPYLAQLLNRIKYPSVKKAINLALDEAAAKAGISRGTLDELSIPMHDLVDGKAEIAIGPDGGAAILEIVGSADVSVAFRRADGKVTASVPTELKEFKPEVSAARAAAKAIEVDLSTQIGRLQRIYLERRDWNLADWTARYAEHPLLAALTRRLIWDVGEGDARRAAVLVDGRLADVSGEAVPVGDRSISLWHPIGKPVTEVLGWRRRLAALRIVQPFKQAHREVYYVTDAELATGFYSNRFAGHILRQHQMMTLARLNHWNVTHRIWADVRNDEPTHLLLPAWNVVAEFWTAGAGGDTPETLDSQAYVYLSTDQVRFYRVSDEAAKAPPTARGPERGEALRIEAVPDIVFSEVMRHCDLFTSVASVANDPNWMDAGAAAEHPDQWRRTFGADYWRDAALGDLSVGAASRKEVVTELLPALRIADRCRIDGNYLRVEGKLRSYKIHFGSGNILMEPDTRYLCIVKGTAKSEGMVMLPFEGDTMLSLILSKAFMLAADDKIEEQAIVRQIVR